MNRSASIDVEVSATTAFLHLADLRNVSDWVPGEVISADVAQEQSGELPACRIVKIDAGAYVHSRVAVTERTDFSEIVMNEVEAGLMALRWQTVFHVEPQEDGVRITMDRRDRPLTIIVAPFWLAKEVLLLLAGPISRQVNIGALRRVKNALEGGNALR